MEHKHLPLYSPLKHRDFRLLWIGQAISLIGTQMQLVGLNWHIYELTRSPAALGLFGLLRFLPILLFGLIAGSYADLHNRKRILIITQSSMTLLSFFLFFLTFRGSITVWLIYLINIFTAIANTFDMPARQSLMPGLVPRKELSNAISLSNMMFYFSSITGPAIGGFVIAHLGISSVYLFNALSFVAVLSALFLMHHDGEIPGKTVVSASLSSMKEGLVFVKKKTIVWSTMLLDFFSTFFASATALLPVFAHTILHVGPMGLGWLYAADSVGAVLAILFIARRGRIHNQGKVLLAAIALYAVGTIVFGISQLFVVSFLGLMLVGAGDGVSGIIRNNIRHLVTPDNIRGRMVAINMIFYMGGPQLGEFEAGILAAAVGAPLSVVLGGVGTLIIIAVMAAKIPLLRNYTNEEEIL